MKESIVMADLATIKDCIKQCEHIENSVVTLRTGVDGRQIREILNAISEVDALLVALEADLQGWLDDFQTNLDKQ